MARQRRNSRSVIIILIGALLFATVIMVVRENFLSKWPQQSGVTSLKLKVGFELETSARIFEILPDDKDAEEKFHKNIQQVQIRCPAHESVGGDGEGGWRICVADPFSIRQPCIVYSFGIGSYWDFDLEITKKYGCRDFAFDPTIGKPDHKPTPLIWFYNTGLGGSNLVTAHNWKMRTFGTLLTENRNNETTIDVLKMDVEKSEWASFETMISEGSLKNVKQLVFELHTREEVKGQRTSSSDYYYYWQQLRGLDRLGFKVWKVVPNMGQQTLFNATSGDHQLRCCHNIHYININYLAE